MNPTVILDETVNNVHRKFFLDLVSRAEIIEYNPEWANGTGYLDHATAGPHAPTLPMDKVFTFRDNYDRQGLIITTPLGNIVVFERYTNKRHVMASNMPVRMEKLKIIRNHAAEEDDLFAVFGDECNPPWGQRLADALKSDPKSRR